MKNAKGVVHKSVRVRKAGNKRQHPGGKGGKGAKRQRGGGGRFDPRGDPKAGWPADRPKNLVFTLAKEGKDTMEAIQLLGQFLHMKPQNFSYAGTKDRRAITYQVTTDTTSRCAPPHHISCAEAAEHTPALPAADHGPLLCSV